MVTLYLTDPGVTLQVVGRAVRITAADGSVSRAYLNSVGQVLLFGLIGVPPEVLLNLGARGVPVIWLSENGRFRARLEGPATGSPSLRRCQYACTQNPELLVGNARAVLDCKLLASRALLLRQQRNHPQLPLAEAIADLGRLRRDLRRAETVAQLRGLEGRAGRIYFRVWNHVLRPNWEFSRRARRPAPDPVNALLSLGYGLVRIELESQLQALGLDPRVGFLHVEHGRRNALALDLLEEFRAEVVDRLVLRCFNLRILTAEHFAMSPEGACRLTAAGRALFLPEYERMMVKPWRDLQGRRLNYRRLLHVQAREIAQSFREYRVYVPHQPRI